MAEVQLRQTVRSEPRLPPQALEAEQSVLGGLLLESSRWDDVAEQLSPEDFYTRSHREIFAAISALQGQNEAVDVVTTAEWLERNSQLVSAGGLEYLGELANNTPGTANLMAYVGIVRERAILRRLIIATSEIAEKAYNPGGEAVGEILDYAEQQVFRIAETDRWDRTGFAPIQGLLTEAIDRIEELYQSGRSVTGVPTGFGLLTCESLEQAIQRAGGAVGNKGVECVQAVLRMADLLRRSPSLNR